MPKCPDADHAWAKLTQTKFVGCFDCRRFEVTAFKCSHGASVPVRWCGVCGWYFFEKECDREASKQVDA